MEKVMTATSYDILNNLPVGIFIIDNNYKILFWNSTIEEWTGLERNNIINNDIREIYENFKDVNFDFRLKQIFEGGPPVIFSAHFHKYIIPIKVRDDFRIQHTTVIPIKQNENDSYNAMFTIQDVTDLSLKIKELRIKSITDPLTLIYNRGYFFEFAQNKIEYAKRSGKNLTITILDIDHFKKVNDNHGHQVGDMILKFFAETLKNGIRPYDILARYGGEEFVILFMDCNEIYSKFALERIKNNLLEKQYNYNGEIINFTFSAGLSELGELNKINCDSLDNLIKLADTRLYKSKKAGRNKITGIS